MPARLGGTGESYRPFYFIAARLLGGAFPMTLLIVPAALAFYTGEISAEKRRAVIYQISMSLAVLLFFSIASVKRDDYILPALPGIAILCASVFTLEVRGCGVEVARRGRRGIRAWSLCLEFCFPVCRVLSQHLPHFKLQSSDAAYYSVLFQTYERKSRFRLVHCMAGRRWCRDIRPDPATRDRNRRSAFGLIALS